MFELQIQYQQLENHYKASVECGSTNFAYRPVYIGKDIGKDESKLPTSKQLLTYAMKQPNAAKYRYAKVINGYIIGEISMNNLVEQLL